MMHKIAGAALVGLAAIAGFAPGASAQCGTGLLIKFDADCFAYETAYTPATFISAPGSQLNVVGIASQMCAPLPFNASDPSKEYTFLWTGLTSAGTSGPTPVGSSTRWQTSYGSGTFAIYEGSPRNAPTAAGGMPVSPPNADVPSKFTDGGPPILTGTLANFLTTITRNSLGNFSTVLRADFTFTGGTAYTPAVAAIGTSILSGAWCANGTSNGLCALPTGYSAHPSGKFDQPVTPASSSTWGTIKQLYR